MFIILSIFAKYNALFSLWYDRYMDIHDSMRRLYKAAEDMKGVTGKSAVAKLLGESPQSIQNWEKRGVSAEGAINAQAIIGCNVNWIMSNSGEMKIGSSAATSALGEAEFLRLAIETYNRASPSAQEAMRAVLDAMFKRREQ